MANKKQDFNRNDKEIDKKRSKIWRKFKANQKESVGQNADKQLSETLRKLSISAHPNIKLTLEEPTLEQLIKCFQEKRFNRIVTMVGAGISTSAGIPDFRTPTQGVYDTLSKYDLPNPQAVFQIDYFIKKPEVFYDLAKTLIPSIDYKPTIAHYFIKMLEIKGLLLRHYTQNVDSLDAKAGISEEKLVEAHGTFRTAHCLKCQKSYTFEWILERMNVSGVPTCVICNTVVKPDIIFFGESLPKKFFKCMKKDFRETDLLIIMGSTLIVEPFASLVRRVDKNCPRVIINNQEVGKAVGIEYDRRHNKRDIFIKGTCDEGCLKIIEAMKWINEFQSLIDQNNQKLQWQLQHGEILN